MVNPHLRGHASCPDCKGEGDIVRKATTLGYVRRPDWDFYDPEGRRMRYGWLTPSGLKSMESRVSEPEFSTLCNCLRRDHGYPLVETIRS